MGHRRYHPSAIDAIGRMIFPEIQPVMRRKHLRFLMLALALGSVFCGVIALILVYLGK